MVGYHIETTAKYDFEVRARTSAIHWPKEAGSLDCILEALEPTLYRSSVRVLWAEDSSDVVICLPGV